jgi:hypothetical protein
MKEIYETYFPDLDLPLIVSFTTHLRNFGYSVKIDYDLYDILVYDKKGELVMGVLSTRVYPNSAEMKSVLADETIEKVILVENPGDLVEEKLIAKMYLAGSDVSIYLNGYGWGYVRGGEPKMNYQQWKFHGLARYSQREDGEWLKECVFCHEKQTLDQYYRRHRWGGRIRDPYRNVCKTCWKERYSKGVDKD